MKRTKIIFIIFAILFVKIAVLAQTVPYFSVLKIPKGIMVGVEIINLKTGSALKPIDFSYEWVFPAVSFVPRKSNFNVISVKEKIPLLLLIDLKVSEFLGKNVYSFKSEIKPPAPKVKIVKKTKNFILPFDGYLKEGESLIVIKKNFYSTSFRYIWSLNGVFLSTQEELTYDFLRKKRGIIDLQVFGNISGEVGSDYNQLIAE